MKAFARHLKNRRKTVIEAWRLANLPRKQPWSAFATGGHKTDTLSDLESSASSGHSDVVLHFSEGYRAGREVLQPKRQITVNFVMGNGTVIDASNNGTRNTTIGLISGARGSLRIIAAPDDPGFIPGEDWTILVYRYRDTKPDVDLDRLLDFSPELYRDDVDGRRPVLEKLRGANARISHPSGYVDGLRMKISHSIRHIELPYTVSASAHDAYERNGPGGTYGRFLVALFPPGVSTYNREDRIMSEVAGALLW